MITFIVRRLTLLTPLLFIISVLSFVIIQLPPGDYLTTYIMTLELGGEEVDQAEIASLKQQYGLDQPLHAQYYKWMKNILLHGKFGRSFQQNKPISDILRERLPLTMLISILAIIFSYIAAIPIGIYSATHQYSVFDYIWTFFGFIGLALPNFLLALVLMWVIYKWTGLAITGLFSPKFVNAPWSLTKTVDLFRHIWLPAIVVGTAGTAGLIRTMRATLLDELGKQYVITVRAKGLAERKLLFKYPVRIALNPIISTIGWVLPTTISGTMITAIVLNLRTLGSALLQAIRSQDMYLAGSIILITASLTVIGTFISDLLLAWLDPRIHYEKRR